MLNKLTKIIGKLYNEGVNSEKSKERGIIMKSKAPGRILLKVIGILLIIFGIIGVIGAVSTIAMATSIKNGQMAQEMIDLLRQAGGDLAVDFGYLMASGVISAISSIVYLVFGILGIINNKKVEKGKFCFVLGIILIVLNIAAAFYNAMYGMLTVWSVVLSLIMPLLYTWGGFKNMQVWEEYKESNGQQTQQG